MLGEYIVSFLPKILGKNKDFPKGSVWGGKSLFKVVGERVLEKTLNFQIYV